MLVFASLKMLLILPARQGELYSSEMKGCWFKNSLSGLTLFL
jgi:hypothetical protein